MAMMFFAMVYRGPSLPGEIRGWFAVFFEIALSLSLAAIIWNYNKWIALFLMLVTVSTFYPYYGPQGYLAGKAVFNGCLWYLFIVMFFSVHNLNMIYRMMRIFTYFHTSVAFFQYFGIAGWFNPAAPIGLMSNPLELSALLSFCLPAFIDLKGKRILLILIPIIGLVIARQFLGIVSLGAGLIFYLAVAYRMYWPVVPVIIAAIFWYQFIDTPGIDFRLYVWKRAITVWKQHWIMGSGIGHWKLAFSRPMLIDGKRWMTTHNEFLQMLFELGIGVIVLFIGYAVDIARKTTRKAVIPLTALVMIVVHCVASFPMHIAPTAIVAVTFLGILTIHERELI